MKKIFFLVILITTLLLLANFVLANENHNLALEDVLEDIMHSQKVEEKNNINCQKVTDQQFEALGEAVMSFMHPDKTQHTLMDQMMGGEGSSSLKAMHIIMGERFLNCSSQLSSGADMMSGMMGGGMMGGGMMGMMPMGQMMNPSTNPLTNTSGNLYNWLNLLIYIFLLILLLVATAALMKWIFKKD